MTIATTPNITSSGSLVSSDPEKNPCNVKRKQLPILSQASPSSPYFLADTLNEYVNTKSNRDETTKKGIKVVKIVRSPPTNLAN